MPTNIPAGPVVSPSNTDGISFTREARIGISVSATARDPNNEKVTVNAKSLQIWPAIPTTNTIGRNTAIVVKVEPVIAPPTSVAPDTLACLIPFFSCCLCL